MRDMSVPLQFASCYHGQEVFVQSSCLLDLGSDFLVGNVVLQEDGCDNGVQQSSFGTERNAPVIPNWFQPCQCCCCLCYPGEYLRLGTLVRYTWPRYLKLVTISSFCALTLISLLMPLVLFVINLVFLALISMS